MERSWRVVRPTRELFLLILFCLLFWGSYAEAEERESPGCPPVLTHKIPPRTRFAMTGSEFGQYVSRMNERQREQAIYTQLLQGNIPSFLRKLQPVRLQQKFKGRVPVTITLCVMPDYLAIGSNEDFLRIPMNLYTATAIARQYGFILPTKKIVDVIYTQAAYRLKPEPMPASAQMRSTRYYLIHNQKIKKQRLALGIPLDGLIAGHKKDVVVTNRLASQRGKIAIYGWHRQNGIPIQPLSTVHGARYADYSHGIRLISEIVLVNGHPRSIYAVLQDPQLAKILSEEGVIPAIRHMISKPSLRQASLSDGWAGN